jgi:hypothetical protein
VVLERSRSRHHPGRPDDRRRRVHPRAPRFIARARGWRQR